MIGRPSASDSRPSPLALARAAWSELQRGATPGSPDPDATAAALVRRWAQHFAVAVDGPVERAAGGAERLPELLDAWLELARRTAPVRAYVARHAGPLCTTEQQRQAALLARLLGEDLALLGVEAPERRAAELVRELERVAAAEDRAGHRLQPARTALLRRAGLATRTPSSACLVSRVACWLWPSLTG